MPRRALLFLLAAGTVAGYASGFASLARWHRYGGSGRSCYSERYNSNPRATPWAPTQAPRATQAPPVEAATEAPAQPGPG